MLGCKDGRCIGDTGDMRNSVCFLELGLVGSENSDGVLEGCRLTPMIDVGGEGGFLIIVSCNFEWSFG